MRTLYVSALRLIQHAGVMNRYCILRTYVPLHALPLPLQAKSILSPSSQALRPCRKLLRPVCDTSHRYHQRDCIILGNQLSLALAPRVVSCLGAS